MILSWSHDQCHKFDRLTQVDSGHFFMSFLYHFFNQFFYFIIQH